VAKVLVVDDEDANRLLASTVLRHAGHLPTEAGTAGEALRIARSELPDLVLVDLSLREGSGADLIRALRADPATRQLRVALYTATHINPALRDFMQLYDVRCVVPKPSEPQELLRAVEAALE